jgi:NAD-dependent SIR2 family protein deacetylase
MKTVYIVGAGLSHYAGLPLQSEFTAQILAARDFRSGPSRTMVQHLDRFVRDVFNLSKTSDQWPDLEDIFTFVDMSANSGHHLGGHYAPKDLRRIRRVLIARTVRMLHQRYERAKKRNDPERIKLIAFLNSLNREEASFVSLNWDTSLERTLLESDAKAKFFYGSGISQAHFAKHGAMMVPWTKDSRRLKIVKMHGSANWLYCDNCRRVFWFPPSETLHVADQIVRKEEWVSMGAQEPTLDVFKCCYCRNVELSTRIATFSFRKALDFPMFQRSWLSAEKELRDSRRWVFIGYSLPAADFEFKYLLKRIELARSRPQIIVVTGGSEAARERTLRNYQGLFGKVIREGDTFRPEGLTRQVIAQITEQ